MPAKKLPLRTHIITAKDDIVRVVRRYTEGIAGPGDIVAVSETAVAIAQGRAVQPERVRPRILARLLCKLPQKDGSLATPAAMELALREAGVPRVLLGVAAAGLGRFVGRRGDFFRVAGRSLAQIDDIGGTLPPYENYIVLGPRDPQGVAERIRRETGLDAVIVDVNDMGRVDILGCTRPEIATELTACLADNPFGNDNEQTPLVLLKLLGNAETGGGPGRGGG